jgi:nitroimidazol reductase NimA-like FMN-containing flavoprotein (pyridoxamine 5'-phosphate oxidase superfamily)
VEDDVEKIVTTPLPQIRPPAVLDAYECWQLLPTEEVARVAWAGRDSVAIVPVNYAVVDKTLWFQTQPYSQLGRHCDGARLALEVDQLDHATKSAWSVVVVGYAEAVAREEVPETVQQMQIWIPGPRSLAVRVSPVEVTGRRVWGRPPAQP